MAMVLEQRHDRVPDDDAEAERHGVNRGEAIEPAVAEEAGLEALTRVARRSGRGRRQREEHCAGAPHDDRAEVRRTPAEPIRQERHDRNGDSRCEHGAAAVEPLQKRRPAPGADVVAAADEGETRADADDGASEKPEPGLGRRQRDSVAEGDEDEPEQRTRPRAEPVGGAPTRDLHERVHHELHRHEEQDDSEAHAVDVREPRGDRPENRNVPADSDADADAADAVQQAGVRPPGVRGRRRGSHAPSSSGIRRSGARSRSFAARAGRAPHPLRCVHAPGTCRPSPVREPPAAPRD